MINQKLWTTFEKNKWINIRKKLSPDNRTLQVKMGYYVEWLEKKHTTTTELIDKEIEWYKGEIEKTTKLYDVLGRDRGEIIVKCFSESITRLKALKEYVV